MSGGIRNRPGFLPFAAALLCAAPAAAQQQGGASPAGEAPGSTGQGFDLTTLAAEARPALPALDKLWSPHGPRDVPASLAALRTLADQGNQVAAMLLGMTYGLGQKGVPRDPALSFRYYLVVASSTRPGNPLRGMAAAEVGMANRLGAGTPEDVAAALKWYRIAAFTGDPTGTGLYGFRLSEDELLREDRDAVLRRWRLAAAQEERVVLTMLGAVYEYAGEPERALFFYERAVARDYDYAAMGAARIYLRRQPRDVVNAFRVVKVAAAHGAYDGIRILATFYWRGEGTRKDLRQAASWFRRTAVKGDPEAMVALVQIYTESHGRVVGEAEALDWAKRGEITFDKRLLFVLGGFYERGTAAMPSDRDRAIRLYRQAAAMGEVRAGEALARLHVPPENSGPPILAPRPEGSVDRRSREGDGE